jgi:hypothetical protein
LPSDIGSNGAAQRQKLLFARKGRIGPLDGAARKTVFAERGTAGSAQGDEMESDRM